MRRAWRIFARAFSEFSEDDAMSLAGALAFYTALSMAPLLLIVIKIAGLLDPNAQDHLVERITEYVGTEGAQAIHAILQSAAQQPASGNIAAALGLATLAFSATGVFAQLQMSLNRIWNVRARPGQGIKGWLRKRMLSFGMVLSIAFLLLISLAISATLAALFPAGTSGWKILNLLATLLVFSAVFAAMFRYVPDVHVGWQDVWVGGAITAILIELGKTAIAIYLARSSVSSAYGAFGSLVVLLLWVYYSAVVFFFGAEITQAYAESRHAPITPNRYAEWAPGSRPAIPPASAQAPSQG